VQAFSQFASDLDKATQAQLARGLRLVEVLKQPQYQPYPLEKQVPIIFAANTGGLDDVPVAAVRRFETEFLAFLADKYPDVPETIARDKVLSPATTEALKQAIKDFKGQFKAE
jgi:F-type H+-transporting ATPase subunit alpha